MNNQNVPQLPWVNAELTEQAFVCSEEHRM